MAVLAGLLASGAPSSADVRSVQSDAVVVRNATASAMEAGPVWVNIATWDPSEQHVVIADPGSGRIYVYDANGRIQRRIAKPGQGPLEFTKPNYPVRVGNRYLIATSLYRWISFNRDFVPQSSFALDWDRGAKYSRLASSEFDFSDTHLYTIGAVMNFDGEWSERAVFAVSLADRNAQRILRLGADDEENSFYRDPPFNLSVCGGKPWLLQMGRTVSIVEARDGGKRLKSFPAEFQRRPQVPRVVDANSVRPREMALRNAPVAEGLFCADERTLLLLAHRPRAGGGLQWLVYPIDPAQDVLGKPIELPTNSAEIVFVPGDKRWAVLEKGPMKYVGVQPLTRIISFPRPGTTSAVKQKTGP